MKQVERDRLKRELCAQRNIALIEVYYDEPLSMELILSKIDDAGLPHPFLKDLGTEPSALVDADILRPLT